MNYTTFLVQCAVSVSLLPAIAPGPRSPIRFYFLREGPKPLLQRGHPLLRFRRSRNERNARNPRADVEVVHPGTRPADERTLTDGPGERLYDEHLRAVPQGIGL